MESTLPLWTWSFLLVPTLFLILFGALVALRPWRWNSRYQNEFYELHHRYKHPFYTGLWYPRAEAPLSKRASARGPRNYRRSDERIVEEINDRLSLGYVDAFLVEVHCKDGHVTLSGSAQSRGERRAIEEMADTVPGVTEITNRLTIADWTDETARAA